MPLSQWSVGVLWSAVATMESTRQGLRPASFEVFEGLRAGDFVDQVTVDIDQRRAVVLGVPSWLTTVFVKRLRLHGRIGRIRKKRENFYYFTGLACW